MSGVPSSSQSMLFGMAMGGVVIASLGAGAAYAIEKKKPTVKSVVRDFIIGTILVLMLLQILPDSAQTLMDSMKSIPSFSPAGLLSGGGAGGGVGEMDIQVGIPKF